MKHIKIISKGWTAYNGLLGTTWFKDGISVEPLPQSVADRLAAVVSFVEINEDGTETPGGAAYRMVTESRQRAPVTRESARQSEAERLEEVRLTQLKAEKLPADRLYTAQELEEAVDAGGIKALRAIADKWGVKERSIPNLIGEILKVQNKFISDRKIRRDALSKKIEAALEEDAIEAKKNAALDKLVQEKADKEASHMVSNPQFERIYTDGERDFPIGIFVERAWAASGMTLTGFNRLTPDKHAAEISAAMRSYEAEFDVELKPVVISAPEKTDELAESETLATDELDPEFDREALNRLRQDIISWAANKPASTEA